MASFLTRVKCVAKSSSSVSSGWEWLLVLRSSSNRCYAAAKAKASSSSSSLNGATMRESSIPSSEKEEDLEDLVPTSGISRPLSEILKELNKKVPDSLIRVRTESDGFPVKYIPWHNIVCTVHLKLARPDEPNRHIVNRIMNLHAPEWSGEVRSITYSADGKSVSVVYRVTLYGTDAEIHKESTGTAPVNDAGYGDPVQKAEAMAFRRACARFGLGLHLYHEDVL